VGINIKNPTTQTLIRELAERTGETQVEAVELAARERLERIGRVDRQGGVAGLVLSIQRGARNVYLDTSALYDDNGLPR
jgi:hypothetical protein